MRWPCTRDKIVTHILRALAVFSRHWIKTRGSYRTSRLSCHHRILSSWTCDASANLFAQNSGTSGTGKSLKQIVHSTQIAFRFASRTSETICDGYKNVSHSRTHCRCRCERNIELHTNARILCVSVIEFYPIYGVGFFLFAFETKFRLVCMHACDAATQ